MIENLMVEIDCSSPRRRTFETCPKCRLPLVHHQVPFAVLKHDPVYDVYVLHARAPVSLELNLSDEFRAVVLQVSGKAYGKFKAVAAVVRA